MNLQQGITSDAEFELMIQKNRFTEHMFGKHTASDKLSICVNIRKRPVFEKERISGEIDAVSVANPYIKVHEPKFKVDGISKYVEDTNFTFDNTFNENENTEDLYKYS